MLEKTKNEITEAKQRRNPTLSSRRTIKSRSGGAGLIRESEGATAINERADGPAAVSVQGRYRVVQSKRHLNVSNKINGDNCHSKDDESGLAKVYKKSQFIGKPVGANAVSPQFIPPRTWLANTPGKLTLPYK